MANPRGNMIFARVLSWNTGIESEEKDEIDNSHGKWGEGDRVSKRMRGLAIYDLRFMIYDL